VNKRGVSFSPESEAQLLALYRFIAARASPAIAQRYTDALVTRCEALAEMPRSGKSRGDLRRGLRVISFRRRVVIAYSVGVADAVTILALYYGGQDWETLIADNGD
jgi:plasmid stabilization system protein ParE